MSTPDKKWEKMVENFIKKAIKFDSVAELARTLNMDPVTVRKILDGKKPNYLTQLKVENFLNDK